MREINEKTFESASGYIQEYLRKKKQMEEMVKSKKYIKWIEKFTEKYPVFNDQSWLYSKEEISEEDNEMLWLLSEFFCYISDFADNCYIYPNTCECGEYYIIEYNNKLYEIGIIVGQGAINFCNTQEVNNLETKIDYSEFITPKDTKIRKENIEKELNELDKFVKGLLKRDVPSGAIEKKIKTILKQAKEANK